MMARKIALVLALMVLPLALQVQALGLGNIKVRSGLNQPLVAEIALLSPRGVAPEDIRVGLAKAGDFARAGIERPIVLRALDFKLDRKSDGTLFIRVTSRRSIREPFLNFLVELSWPSGRLLREYTVLLDPPTFSGARAPAPRPAAAAAPAPAYGGDTYRVSRGDTLWSIAQRTRPDASVSPQQMMVALQRGNPRAFINGNMNNLMAGQVLRIPEQQAIGALSDAEARREVQRQYEAWRQARTAPPAPAPGTEARAEAESAPEAEAAPAAPVEPQPEETLPAAEQPLPEQAAPEPEVPEPEVPEAVEPESVKPEAGAGEAEAEAPAAMSEQPSPATGEGELKLLAPEDTAAVGQAGEAPVAEPGQTITPAPEEALDSVRQELALTTESVDTLQRENTQLQERFAELESQVDSLQKLIDLKDAELASLQLELDRQETVAADAGAGEERIDLIGRLLRDPVNLGVLAAAVLILLLIVWMMTRRRSTGQTVEPAAARVPAGTPEAAAAAAATGAALTGAATVESEELSGPETSGLPPRPAGSDPVAEAGVYIAYGRFSQAEELLQSLLETRPNDANARLKLLEVYYATRDRDAFEAEAAELFEQVTEEDPMWLKAAEMGRELCPGVPMFAPRRPATATPSAEPGEAVAPEDAAGAERAELSVEEEAGGTWHEKTAPAGEESEAPFAVRGLDVEPEPEQQRTDETGVNFDLDFLREEATGEESHESRAAEQMPAIDFDIDELEREARKQVASKASELDEELSGLELDLELDTGHEAVEEAFEPHPAIETEPEKPTLAASADLSSGELQFDEEGGEDQLDLLPDVDEVSTKLDLARAYIDMGDEEGAREILEEVLGEGNEGQQQEARDLLNQMTQ
jgi:pilus assembly protein FimV